MASLGIAMGLEFLRVFYHGGSLYYAPMLFMVLLTLVGSFMALTGIILHTLSRLIHESKGEFKSSGITRYEHRYSPGNPTRDN